ncbi:hypothetical protein ACWGN5_00720 [Streptomyces sp. NPDC055815]
MVDEQAGQLRCSTGSVPAEALPFGSAYELSDELGPVIEGFLADSEPDITGWLCLEGVQNHSEPSTAEREAVPIRVWASSVGATSR